MKFVYEKYKNDAFNRDLTGNHLDLIICQRHFGIRFQIKQNPGIYITLQSKKDVFFLSFCKLEDD